MILFKYDALWEMKPFNCTLTVCEEDCSIGIFMRTDFKPDRDHWRIVKPLLGLPDIADYEHMNDYTPIEEVHFIKKDTLNFYGKGDRTWYPKNTRWFWNWDDYDDRRVCGITWKNSSACIHIWVFKLHLYRWK